MQIKRRTFYAPEKVVGAVRRKIDGAKLNNEPIDYLTFVPDGEPTLDKNLGKELALLGEIGMKTAVISNASLIWMADVRTDLAEADWVSLKIDTVDQDIWRKINRPHREPELQKILDGIMHFSQSYTGDLATETMLLQDVNDKREIVERVAGFTERLNPRKSYVSIPTRTPA